MNAFIIHSSSDKETIAKEIAIIKGNDYKFNALMLKKENFCGKLMQHPKSGNRKW